MEEWKEYKIGDVCKIKRGASPRPIQQFLSNKGMPWVKIADATASNSMFLDSTKEYIIEEGVSKSVTVLPGTLIVSNSATPGLPKVIRIKACVHDGWLVISDFKGVLRDFMYYKFVDIRRNLSNQANGSVFQNLKTDIVRDYSINIPSLKTQEKIVSILKSLDDKIEVNRKINENLEQQAQALFKSWFVDFEPFKNGEFVESELGMIPKGLSLNYISEIPHVLETGRRPKGGVGEIAQGIPSVGAEHVKGIGTYDYSKTKYITPEYASSLKTGKVEGYELLIYKDGGKPGYFIPNYSIFGEGYPFEECYLNEHVFKLDFDDKGYNAFCYFYFRTDYVMNYLNAQGGKAAIPGINKQDIENIPIYSQNNEIVKHFGDVVLPLIKQILFNCKESRRLASLRDTLLPKLMSGELKVNELENSL